MDQQLSLVTLGVEDLHVSRAFYSEGLGWSPALDLEEIVFYQVGHGMLLALFPLAALSEDQGVAAARGTSFTLATNVASEAAVDAAVERARNAGATVIKAPQHAAFGGYHAYVADPDGHRWEIACNPGLGVAVDGTVVFSEASGA
jgi:catechol 2,3-dioxygenase-like lactoylglutathione lyase family enzyme